MVRLLACPACDCHAFATETHCPSCGSSLRAPDGSLPRTAGAILLGLTLTTATTACGDSTGSGSSGGGAGEGGAGQGGMQVVSAYGVGPGGGFGSGGDPGTGGAGGTAGTGGAGGAGGN